MFTFASIAIFVLSCAKEIFKSYGPALEESGIWVGGVVSVDHFADFGLAVVARVGKPTHY